jgi:hypothetical protein
MGQTREGTTVKWLAVIFVAVLVIAGVALSAAQITSPDKVPRMIKEQLKPMIGNENLVILDARIAREWDSSPTKIKGAIRCDPSNAQALMGKIPKDKTLVFYCD